MTCKRLFICLLLLTVIFEKSFSQIDSVTVSLKAIPGIKFNIVRFSVKPGDHVKLILENGDDMEHNLLLTKPGSRLIVVNAALQMGADGPKFNYVPQTEKVLWHIPVLHPGEVKSINFVAPKEEGIYPYVCTYPGHGFIMYGAMYVITDPEEMPPLAEDENIPQSAVQTEEISHHDHSESQVEITEDYHHYKLKLPAVYRTFLPGSSPAAIAVGFPNNISYCWDAGNCRLRFAWKGGFVNNMPHWSLNGKDMAEIVGKIFYKEKSGFPIRIGDTASQEKLNFQGYRLINGIPKFEYTIGNIKVYETIKPLEKGEGDGLLREFSIKTQQPVFFVVSPVDGVTYHSNVGIWKNNILYLTSPEAEEFIIKMKRK